MTSDAAQHDKAPDATLLGFACEHCSNTDPFETQASLDGHRLRVHRLATPLLSQAGEPKPLMPLDASKLATIDLAGRASSEPVDVSPEAVFDRQVRLGEGLWDPLTMLRVVVLDGEIKVRQTVGVDQIRGQAERKDYWHAEFGWVREGLIVERGRARVASDGKVLVV